MDGVRSAPEAASGSGRLPSAGDSIGPYRLVRKLGEGGMGAVWEAVHVHLDRHAALKLLPAKFLERPEAVARFYREMKAAGRVVHPHVVQAHDAGEANGVHYLAMELVVGADLHQLVSKKGPLSVLHAARALRQAALGLSAAHAQGLVHRDVKPMNLLVGKDGKVKLLDLGLARLAEDAAADASRDGLTTAGMVMGTPDYMAPEQWEDSHSAGPGVDLYALGCTLYFVLTGRAPFADDRHVSAVRKMAGHVTETPPDLASARPDVPAKLCEIYRRLMAKKPEDRPASAVELAELLLPFTIRSSDAKTTDSPAAETDSLFVGAVAPAVSQASSTIPTALAAPVTAKGPVIEVGRPRKGKEKSTAAGSPPIWRRSILLAGAGGMGVVLLVLGVVITITNKDGTKTVITAPDAKSVEVERNGETVAKVETADAPTAPAAMTPSGDVGPPTVSNPLPGLAATEATKSWHGWPADAPPPAIAPFDAEQATKHQEAWATYLGVPIVHENSLGMKFRLIPPGEFLMGSTPENLAAVLQAAKGDTAWTANLMSQTPRHRTVLTRAFYLSEIETTLSQFERATGSTRELQSAAAEGEDAGVRPIEVKSFAEAATFCAKLDALERRRPRYAVADEIVTVLPRGDGYRLPSEAQWEFACRAGAESAYWGGDREEDALRNDWFQQNSGVAREVGLLPANPFGLHDLHGNLHEFCEDYWALDAYEQFAGSLAVDPLNAAPSERSLRVLRGGAAQFPADGASAGTRSVDFREGMVGFRIVLPVDAVKSGHSDGDPVEAVP